MTVNALAPRGRTRGRLREYAPVPLVGIVVLLVVVILVTPVLVSEGQPAPGILTQAELIVDRIPGNATFHFYVRGLGSIVRYDEIAFGTNTSPAWSGAGTPQWSSITWTRWANDSFVLASLVSTTANPVAVNITAYYASSAGSASYRATIAFYVGPSSTTGGLVLFASSPTPGLAVAASTPLDNTSLPLTILMPLTASGGPP